MTNTDKTVSNTDREIWRETEGDAYASSIHVTQSGGIGINVGGMVHVMPVEKWHQLASRTQEPAEWDVGDNVAERLLLQVRKFIAAETKHAEMLSSPETELQTSRDSTDLAHADLTAAFTVAHVDQALRIVRRRAATPPASERSKEEVGVKDGVTDLLIEAAEEISESAEWFEQNTKTPKSELARQRKLAERCRTTAAKVVQP